MATHRFRPRYRPLALGTVGIGGALVGIAAVAGFVALPLVTGVLGMALGGAYLGMPMWRLAVTVDELDGSGDLSSALEVAAYRIATEAMTNTLRHAQATGCEVQLRYDGIRLDLRVADDGSGEPARGVGTGLTSMRERAEELGGVCTVTFRPGRGTEVAASFPTTTASQP